MYFIDVILPIPLKQTFTYSVSDEEAGVLQTGMRVAVPFGKSKIFTGIVAKVYEGNHPDYEVKPIDQILDEYPIINLQQLKHWLWMANYYMCTLGEVIRAGLPNTFLLESETRILLNPETNVKDSKLSNDEFLVYEALQYQSALHVDEIRTILDRKNILKVIQSMLNREVVTIQEEIVDKYKPKLVRYIRFNPKYKSEPKIRELLDTMNRAPRQKEVLMNLYLLSAQKKGPVSSLSLQKKSKASAAVIKTLIDKEILEYLFIQKDRLEYRGGDVEKIKTLNEDQKTALTGIRKSFERLDVTLLHGVTSSGKTEIYVKLIEEMLDKRKQVLYILPEIALTSQLIRRLQKYFGEKVSVYHSKFSSNERVEIWRNVLNKEAKAQIVIGARSTLFLPFSDLGLVIVDEEHEPSFKQYNPAPRYHARDSAIVLAKQHKAKVILGSATPSIESYYNAQQDKYGLVTLKKRYGDIVMPDIELVDIKEKYRKKKMKGHFSDRLLEAMEEALGQDEQIILFQNRRGYSPVVECNACGTSPQCPNCDVSLTYHQYKNELRCHYCGYRIPMLESCNSCGNISLDTKGFGTEQIEKELRDLFPDHSIARMDHDTTRKKYAYDKIIESMENKEIDIVVGTQMLAKGLDFRNVGLVGVMNADNLLNFPDFRAHERSFQLLQQVSGRAGRFDKQGKVLIQTFNPFHQILQQVSTNDYEGMYDQQLEERYQYKYPPFHRTIKLTFKDRDQLKMKRASKWFGDALRQYFKEAVLGPEPPPIGRIRNLYLINILIKISKEGSLVQSKEIIHGVFRSFHSIKEFSSVRIIIDVDQY